jgi:hypothetical protein
VDRDRAADDCARLLELVARVRARWRSSPDPQVRDLAPRLDELVHVLARLEQLFARAREP